MSLCFSAFSPSRLSCRSGDRPAANVLAEHDLNAAPVRFVINSHLASKRRLSQLAITPTTTCR
jgi:hypothetical protein